ncbi:MAG: o-succinylbenzoate synthase [Acidimicrobiia bacterium]|nr:o-succinylbenzoate synthase [Acidimicrobiia bacterium]
MPSLDPLPTVRVEAVEILRIPMRLTTPLRTAAGTVSERDVVLIHVLAREAEGWAELVAEAEPTYSPEFTDSAITVLLNHLLPRAAAGPMGDALALGPHLDAVRGHPMARAALELAILDAQLRQADRSLSNWLGATATHVPAGAALGLHERVEDLLAEADAAVALGASRLRVKIAPGSAAEPLRALRAHGGPQWLLQADANGSFALNDPELDEIDEVGLVCLEQPLDPNDLLGHAALARRLVTPICLDEPLTSLGAVEAAVALGACEVVCLKPARVGGWINARAVHDRCVELGVPVWVGGMLETGIGRAANLAVAALAGMAFPADLDPRGRFDPDLADRRTPVDGLIAVPTGPGTDAVPDLSQSPPGAVVGSWTPSDH